jgi:hypothetical protein
MNVPTPKPSSEEFLRPLANDLMQWSFLHLVQELRSANILGQPSTMPPAIQDALLQAELGAVHEIVSLLPAGEEWVIDWQANGRGWALISVLGEENLSVERARQEIEKSIRPQTPPYYICGLNAVRDLDQFLQSSNDKTKWLDTYEGMFAAMLRLWNVL